MQQHDALLAAFSKMEADFPFVKAITTHVSRHAELSVHLRPLSDESDKLQATLIELVSWCR